MEQPVFLNATQMSSPAEGIDAVRLGATILPENPFVGLRPFESKEAVLFFGRRDQTKQLLSILHASRFVAVVGSSGCGKSSLIRAGLIPNLQAGFVAGNVDRWNIITMKPGNSPLQNLATALLNSFEENPQPAALDALVENIRLFGVSAVTKFLDEQTKGVRTNFLLLVDQFEEIFRFAAYEDKDEKTDSQQNKLNEQIREKHREEATDLVSIMLDLVVQESIPVYVVMTMRSDFLGECDAFYGLPEAMNKSQYLVPRLTRQQRQQAIENPVQFYGAAISDRLTDRVLNDMEEERDQLPIMQHALMRTWEKWQINKAGALDLSHYVAAGTVAEALSKDADDAMKGLSKDECVIAERMFQALTTTDAKGRRLRRPTHLSELAAITGSKEVVLKLIDRFRDNNRCFLMLSADRDPLVDISHESLIRQWGTLRKWVDEEVTSRDAYLRLANEAVRYEAKEAALLSDPALQLALNWWSKRKPTEAWGRRYHKEFKLAEDFLQKSEKKRNDDALEAQRVQDQQAKREREDLERAQRQAELEKEQAQKLAAARASKIRRTRVFALLLLIFSVLVSFTAVWALKAQRDTKEAKKVVDAQKDALKKSSEALEELNRSLITAKENADKAKDEAVRLKNDAETAKDEAVTASLEAKRQENIAKGEKAKVVLALKKADQTAEADRLRRQAANEQNAGEVEDAEKTYHGAVEAYKQINDKEGIAYTYSELGNMLTIADDVFLTVGKSYPDQREHWNELFDPNWIERVLLGKQADNAYFSSIGLTKTQAKALDYYAHAIKAYGEIGGDSGLNGVGTALDKVGDLMKSRFLSADDQEAQDFAKRQRALATRDSFCGALENFKRAGNLKRRIAVLNKIGEGLKAEKPASPNTEDNTPHTKRDSEIGGCQNLGNNSATYFEESVKLYPELLKKYGHDTNQYKKNRKAFGDLLIRLGSLYMSRSQNDQGPPDQTQLNLATTRFEQAAEIFRADGEVESTASTYKTIGDGLKEGDLKVHYYQLGAAEFHKNGQIEAEAEFLAALGRRYYSRVRALPIASNRPFYEKSIFYLDEGLKLYQQLGKRNEYSSIYWTIGLGYRYLNKNDEALMAFQAALSNSLSIGDTKVLPRDYFNVGYIQELKGAKDEAKKAYDEIMRLTANDQNDYYRGSAQIGLKRLRGELPPLNSPKAP